MLKLNCGLSYPEQDAQEELKKIELANKYSVDYVSIISIDKERTKWFWELVASSYNWADSNYSDLPKPKFKLCSAPLYESIMFNEDIFDTMKRHFSYGVKAMTFHVTSTALIERAAGSGFIVNSRGGVFTAESSKANPITERWNEIVDFCCDNNIEIFIGTSLRPGVCENNLSEWTLRDLESAVSYYDSAEIRISAKKPWLKIYLETLGHVKGKNLHEYEDICGPRRICAMGPILTDSTNGFDELNSIIGFTLVRATTNLNLQVECMVSRKEHIDLPNLQDVEDEIQKWKVAELVTDVTLIGKKPIGKDSLEKEKEVLKVKSAQRTQCSAHYNLFGAMDIIPTCRVCGNKCPLTSEKLRKAND